MMIAHLLGCTFFFWVALDGIPSDVHRHLCFLPSSQMIPPHLPIGLAFRAVLWSLKCTRFVVGDQVWDSLGFNIT